MSWYHQGSVDKEYFEDVDKESQSGRMIKRAWIPKNGENKYIFLDDLSFCIWEHQLKINGDFRNWYTCRKKVDPKNPRCPLCDARVKRYHVGYLTVLDATGWKITKGEDKGKVVMYQRQLFPMKVDTLKIFEAKKRAKTTLVNAMFSCQRIGTRSPVVGDVHDFIEYVEPSPFDDEKYWFYSRTEGKKLPPEVYNYLEILKPLEAEDMRALVASRESDDEEGGSWGSGKGGDDDEAY